MVFVRRDGMSFRSPERGGAIIEFSVVIGFLVFLVTGFVDIAIQLRDQGNLFEVSRAVGRDISRITSSAPDITTAGVCRRAAVYFYVLGLEPKEYELVLTPRMINAGENVEALPLLEFEIERRAPNAFNSMFKNYFKQYALSSFHLESGLPILQDDGASPFVQSDYSCSNIDEFRGT